MMALRFSNRGYILHLILLFLPGHYSLYSLSLEPERSQINYLNVIIQNVLKERPADTLLILKRRQDLNCTLKEFHPHHLIPTLRLDESTIVSVKDHFNSEVIALVCISELADSMLLTALAKDLHRMREARILIWLHILQTNPNEYLDAITDHANNYNFLSLIVLHSTSSNLNKSIVAYRLHPFPNPIMIRIMDLNNGTIFPNLWRNFYNKTAVVKPNLHIPASFLSRDEKSGQIKLSGFLDKIVLEFTKKHNIHVRLPQKLDSMERANDAEIENMTLNGKIDLSIHGRVWKASFECTSFVGFSDIFIALFVDLNMSRQLLLLFLMLFLKAIIHREVLTIANVLVT